MVKNEPAKPPARGAGQALSAQPRLSEGPAWLARSGSTVLPARTKMTAALACACALALAACGEEHVDDYGGVLDFASVADGGLTQQFTPKTGYVGQKRMEYYDFGEA